MNRRRSLMLAAAGGPLLGPLPALAAVGGEAPRAMPSAAVFSALVGQTLQVDGQSYRLRAVRLGPSRQPRIEQFSLVLRGAAGLPAGLHALQHPQLGSLQLHFESGDQKGRQLRADITRLA
jgi:hypothetical protein